MIAAFAVPATASAAAMTPIAMPVAFIPMVMNVLPKRSVRRFAKRFLPETEFLNRTLTFAVGKLDAKSGNDIVFNILAGWRKRIRRRSGHSRKGRRHAICADRSGYGEAAASDRRGWTKSGAAGFDEVNRPDRRHPAS